MIKVSKVKSVQGNGTYENQHGLFYKFDYEFDDGEQLTASHRNADNHFKVGTEVQYEIKGSNDYGKWGKVSVYQHDNRATQGNTYNEKGIKVGHAVNNAVILHSSGHSATSGLTMRDNIKQLAVMIYQISNELNEEL